MYARSNSVGVREEPGRYPAEANRDDSDDPIPF